MSSCFKILYIFLEKVSEMALEDHVSLRQLMEKFEISRSTLYRLESDGKIHFRRVRGKIFVSVSEIEKVLKDSCKGCD